MKRIRLLTVLLTLGFMLGCSSSKNNTSEKTSAKEQFDKRNTNVSLLTRMRQLPGVVIKNGVPVINKTANNFSSGDNSEPLYILNGLIVGNSFNSINQLVDNFSVKKIEVITGSDASFYGTRGAKGVIKITTFN
ncbi:MAG: TonB-dependent receptor plug domain-containing protein [Croceitalea sp.]|nr:TonB-dependent receptor plug domain-containing protein [Croceitalea sp.]MBT8239113.1 TonB-dependent receptor plug domain-containing protein [Croceitalea sp.]NNC34353.1 TonB-dependent receptor plug domain-containing protein [Croceitalea sp.]NNL08734.1 TonB-dependent receptor plug domain-containing protein [Croceitalea sp.]NNM18331.1 TonB-dependent receptor plug domain-containing protein [Croceitalea sp.]